METNDIMKEMHEDFVRKHGHNPTFAVVVLQWDGETEQFSDAIKLQNFNPDDTEHDPDDRNVVFYADGLEGLLEINSKGIADFRITDIYEFTDTLA